VSGLKQEDYEASLPPELKEKQERKEEKVIKQGCGSGFGSVLENRIPDPGARKLRKLNEKMYRYPIRYF
jgi:hypothetical protein